MADELEPADDRRLVADPGDDQPVVELVVGAGSVGVGDVGAPRRRSGPSRRRRPGGGAGRARPPATRPGRRCSGGPTAGVSGSRPGRRRPGPGPSRPASSTAAPSARRRSRVATTRGAGSPSAPGGPGPSGGATRPTTAASAGRRRLAELRPPAVEQPDRLDRGQLDDPEDDLGGDRHAGLVVVPGPDRDPEPPGQVRAAPLADELDPELAEPLGDPAFDLHHVRGVLSTRHEFRSPEELGRRSASPVECRRGPSSQLFLA